MDEYAYAKEQFTENKCSLNGSKYRGESTIARLVLLVFPSYRMIDREITLVNGTKGTVVPLRGEEHTLVACTPSSLLSKRLPRLETPRKTTVFKNIDCEIQKLQNQSEYISESYEPSLSICRSSLVL